MPALIINKGIFRVVNMSSKIFLAVNLRIQADCWEGRATEAALVASPSQKALVASDAVLLFCFGLIFGR